MRRGVVAHRAGVVEILLAWLLWEGKGGEGELGVLDYISRFYGVFFGW